MLRTALTCLFAFVLAQNAISQELVRRMYDLRALLVPHPPHRANDQQNPPLLLPRGPVLPSGDSESVIRTDVGEVKAHIAFAPYLDRAKVLDWLRPAWKDVDKAKGQIQNNQLLLWAPAEVQARVHEFLSVIAATALQPLDLEIHVLPVGAGTDLPAVLSGAQVAALLARQPPLLSHTATPLLDVPIMIENGRSVCYLRDYDIEIAEKSEIADPKMDVFFVGDRLGLGITPLADGRLLLRTGCSTTKLLDFKRRALRGQPEGIIQLPVVDSIRVQVAVAISDGGGLLLGSDDGERRLWLIVGKRRRTAQQQKGDVKAVAMGSLMLPLFRADTPPSLIVSPGNELFSRADSPSWTRQDAYALVDRYAGGALKNVEGPVHFVGSYAIVADSGTRRQLREAMRAHAKGLRSWSVQWRFGAVERKVARSSAPDFAAALPVRGCLGTLEGHEFSATAGKEMAFLRDFEVEIASAASAANPVVGVAFSGWFLRGTLSSATTGVILDYDWLWTEVDPGQPLDMGTKKLGDVDRPETYLARAAERLFLEPGHWQVVNQQPDPRAPRERILALAVRVLRVRE